MLPAGIYAAVRNVGQSSWSMYNVDDHDGGVALHRTPDGAIYAVITRGSWDAENQTVLKKSTDGGKTWTLVTDNVCASRPDVHHQFFLQTMRAQRGSKGENTLYGMMTNHASATPVDGLYSFEMMFLSIQLP
jgi:hypothetical protein